MSVLISGKKKRIRRFFVCALGIFLSDKISSVRCWPSPFDRRVKKRVYEHDFESSQGLSLDSPLARQGRELREKRVCSRRR